MGKVKKADLSVRQLSIKDIVGYLRIAKTDDVGKFVDFLSADSLDEARKRIEHYQKNYNETIYGLFGKSNRLMALLDVTSYPGENVANVSYMVGKQYRGNGYAGVAICKLFDLLDFKAFLFDVHKSNFNSQRVQEKLHSRLCGSDGDYYQYLFAM